MQILNIFHVLIAISMVAFILVQKGAGATAGAAFGSGASGTVFGARGAGNFLSRSTWVMAALFCLISLSMAVIVSRNSLEPETDLGVVATGPAVEEQANPVESGLNTDIPVTSEDEDTVASDLPTIGTPDAATPVADTVGELPGVEPEAVTTGEEKKTVDDDGS